MPHQTGRGPEGRKKARCVKAHHSLTVLDGPAGLRRVQVEADAVPTGRQWLGRKVGCQLGAYKLQAIFQRKESVLLNKTFS